MREVVSFGGLFNARDETKVPLDRCWAMQNCTVLNGVLEGSPRYTIFGSHDGVGGNANDVGYGFGYGKHSANEIQRLTVTGTPTGGTVVLEFDGKASESELNQTTATIAYNATAAAVQTALEGTAGIAIGDVRCTGGPWPGAPIDVEFRGQYANTDMRILVLNTNSLTGGSTPSVTITERVAGGETEVYLVAVKKNGDSTVTMYKVNASTGAFTSVATGLNASDWFFQQYKDKIYAVNAVDGMHFFRIGGSWNDGATANRPKAPSFAPTFSVAGQDTLIDFSTGFTSITQSGLGAATVTGTATGISILNTGGAITDQTQITVTATYTSNQDIPFNDIWMMNVESASSSEATFDSATGQLVIEDASTNQVTPIASTQGQRDGNIRSLRFHQFANSERVKRGSTKKLIMKFTVTSMANNKTIYLSLRRGLSWMCDRVPFTFEADPNYPKPTQAKVRYAYSYWDAANSVESLLSEDAITQPIPGSWRGCNVTVTMYGSSELAITDRIYVYRRRVEDGTWRRLPGASGVADPDDLTSWGVANVTSGTTTFVDKWMEEELKDFPQPNPPTFGGSRNTRAGLSIGAWKQSLVVGGDRKAWLSFVGQPDRFAPDPDDIAATQEFVKTEGENPDRGRTVYMSDDRAEDVNSVLGQDSLYLVGPLTSYAMVGDSPAESSPPRRLPGSRGSVGKRAAIRYRGGIHIGSEDGLWFHAVGRGFSGEDNGALVIQEETQDVRRSYVTTLLGSSYSGLAVVEHNDELWVFNGTKYLRNNRNKSWEEGTFADSVLAALSVRSRGLRFVDSKGRVFTILSTATTDNGTSASWSYTTGLLEGPRVRINELEVHGVGSPRVTVDVYRESGAKSDTFGRYDQYVFDKPPGQSVWRIPCVIASSERHRLSFSGTVGSDKVTLAAVHYEGTGKAYNG